MAVMPVNALAGGTQEQYADLFGVRVRGLAVMALAFGRNGTLYAVGDCNPAPKRFECTPGPAAYNSLYKVNAATGCTRPISPRIPGLYRIDTKTGSETAIAALPFGFSSGLELIGSGG